MAMSWTRCVCLGGVMLLLSTGGASALTARTDPDNVEPIESEQALETDAAAQKWDFSFSSLGEFAERVRCPTLKIVSTGDTKNIYYVFLRRDHYLFVVDWARRGSRLTKNDIRVENAKDAGDVLVQNAPLNLPAPLAKMSTVGPPVDEWHKIQLTYVKEIKAQIFTIEPDFKGKLSVTLTVSNDKFENAETTTIIPW